MGGMPGHSRGGGTESKNMSYRLPVESQNWTVLIGAFAQSVPLGRKYSGVDRFSTHEPAGSSTARMPLQSYIFAYPHVHRMMAETVSKECLFSAIVSRKI